MSEALREERVGPSDRAPLERYELPPWRDQFGIVAGITSAASDFTLAGGPPAGGPRGAWDRFRTQFAASFPAFVVGYQSHGTTVAVHRSRGPGWEAWPDVDGHVTNAPGLLLAATVADCIPIYLVERRGRAVGILHAGWRGLARGIVEQGVASLQALAGCTAADIVSHCGTGICGDCYEVGPEVVEQVLGQRVAGQARLDLRAAVRSRLARMGVGATTSSPWCTAHDAPRFHSHRRSKGRAGRMLAYVGIPIA